jgi:hypothetical protein
VIGARVDVRPLARNQRCGPSQVAAGIAPCTGERRVLGRVGFAAGPSASPSRKAQSPLSSEQTSIRSLMEASWEEHGRGKHGRGRHAQSEPAESEPAQSKHERTPMLWPLRVTSRAAGVVAGKPRAARGARRGARRVTPPVFPRLRFAQLGRALRRVTGVVTRRFARVAPHALRGPLTGGLCQNARHHLRCFVVVIGVFRGPLAKGARVWNINPELAGPGPPAARGFVRTMPREASAQARAGSAGQAVTTRGTRRGARGPAAPAESPPGSTNAHAPRPARRKARRGREARARVRSRAHALGGRSKLACASQLAPAGHEAVSRRARTTAARVLCAPRPRPLAP